MGAGQLACVGIGTKVITGDVVESVDPPDLTWRRVPNQLQQGDPTVFYRRRKWILGHSTQDTFWRLEGRAAWQGVMLDQDLLGCWVLTQSECA